jgi:hypothetical protein
MGFSEAEGAEGSEADLRAVVRVQEQNGEWR